MSIEINNYNANICITPQINNTEYNTFKDELQHELNTLMHERDTFINPELDYLKQEYTNINYEYDQLSILSDRVTKLQTKCNNTYNNLIGLLRRINNGEVSNDDNTSTIIVNYTKLLNKRTNKYHNVYDEYKYTHNSIRNHKHDLDIYRNELLVRLNYIKSRILSIQLTLDMHA